MNVRLVDIVAVKSEWQTAHAIKALEIEGRNPAIAAMAGWARNNQQDYKRLMRAIKLVCGNEHLRNPKYLKKSDNPKHDDVYEIRADKGLLRLFCFYSRGTKDVVICTHGWGKCSSRRQQDAEFEKCARFKRLYEEYSTS